jgi:hypothetical protein
VDNYESKFPPKEAKIKEGIEKINLTGAANGLNNEPKA